MNFNDIEIRTRYPQVFLQRREARFFGLESTAVPGVRGAGFGDVGVFAQTCLKGLRHWRFRHMKRASKRRLQS